jgi:hypothetical protein
MAKEPDMNRDTLKQYIEEQQQERIESLKHQAQLAKKPRANDKQIGGDHYKNMGVEPWEVVDTWPLYQRIGFYRGGALKYIMRLGGKDEMEQEAGKGLHYLEKLVEVLKEQSDE